MTGNDESGLSAVGVRHPGVSETRANARPWSERAFWLMGAYGFVSGLPLSLSGFTLRLWLADGGASLALIGLTANIGLAYSLKFLWAPLLDNAAPPGLLRLLGRGPGWLAGYPAGPGRRRGAAGAEPP